VIAAQLLERGFANNGLSWLRPSLGTVDNLVPIDASPPNLRDEMCGGKRHKPASDEDEDTTVSNAGGSNGGETGISFFTAGLQPPMPKTDLLAAGPATSEPMVVYTGPKKTGAALIAAVSVDSDKQTTPRRGKKSRLAAKKPDAAAEPKAEAKPDAPKAAAKPATVRHASAKPDSAPKAAEKPVAAADKPAAKPAKPKAVAKPAVKPTAGDPPRT
jgi:D-alanyl-D-alanine carboxypeptidase